MSIASAPHGSGRTGKYQLVANNWDSRYLRYQQSLVRGSGTPVRHKHLAVALAVAIAAMVAAGFVYFPGRQALRRGVLLVGGGALRADITGSLAERLHAHTAAVRGAAKLLQAAHAHPSATTG
ncbi:hypothetical protein ABZ770_30575 [Streptomyces sp. NPDC006654]|uniref:hypothetical protein n=1 Tax=Streptomyces sp. NPDC006654 TaxID=3156897 RepID=UPI0033FF1B74